LRVLVFGAGGVGGYLGAKLSKVDGIELELVARGEHLETIKRDGLRLIEGGKESQINLKAVDAESLTGLYDLVLITVKSNDLDGAITSIKRHISKDSVIIPIMNGVDNAKRVQSQIKDARVLNGCIYIISNIKSAGVVEKKGNIFKLCWGDRDIDSLESVSRLFDEAGFRHKLTSDIELEVWRKFLFIAPMAMMTSYYSLDMSEIYDQKFNELKEAMEEVVEVANSLGVELDSKDISKNLIQASKVQKGAKTSMQLDLEKGRESEIDSLIGFVAKSNIKRGIFNKIYRELKR
jgi:2-dehydropantoate 2-reductase